MHSTAPARRAVIAALLAAAISAAACGSVNDVNAARTPEPKASAAAPSEPEGTRLSAVRTYSYGNVRFDPAPPDSSPALSPEQALQRHTETGLYPYASKYSTPTVQFALFTAYDTGVAAKDGDVVPTHVRRPVWVVTFTGVPDQGSGGASSGDAVSSAPETVLHEIVSVIDAATGKPLLTMSTLRDEIPYPTRG